MGSYQSPTCSPQPVRRSVERRGRGKRVLEYLMLFKPPFFLPLPVLPHSLSERDETPTPAGLKLRTRCSFSTSPGVRGGVGVRGSLEVSVYSVRTILMSSYKICHDLDHSWVLHPSAIMATFSSLEPFVTHTKL